MLWLWLPRGEEGPLPLLLSTVTEFHLEFSQALSETFVSPAAISTVLQMLLFFQLFSLLYDCTRLKVSQSAASIHACLCTGLLFLLSSSEAFESLKHAILLGFALSTGSWMVMESYSMTENTWVWIQSGQMGKAMGYINQQITYFFRIDYNTSILF